MRTLAVLAPALALVGCKGGSQASITCIAPLLTCNTTCVDPQNDLQNCGSCGHACPSGSACTSGVCNTFSCSTGTTCGDSCVDLNTSSVNCGSCGHACPTGASCQGGVCIQPGHCGTGVTSCSGVCVDLATDSANCGSCGHACPSGSVCTSGVCKNTLSCSTGTACGDSCVDLNTSSVNCGSCGHACTTNAVCSSGECVCESSPVGDLTWCGDACVSLMYDPSNCGACGHACHASTVCRAGECACLFHRWDSSVLKICGGVCTNPFLDPFNCGGCGHACATGDTCLNGNCHTQIVCSPDLTACGEQCVDEQRDPQNCGACLKACSAGQVCQGGQCACPASQSLCGDRCADLCGACASACVNGEVCSSSACVCATGTKTCPAVGLNEIATACYDVMTDAYNCGTCGHACPAGQTCSGGTCTSEASAFRMLGGDGAHSGYLPGETGSPPPSTVPAWSYDVRGSASPAVIEGGRVYVTSSAEFGHNNSVFAFEASNGALLWQYDLGAIFAAGWPAVSGGKVYVATSSNLGDTFLYELSRDGERNWCVGFDSQWDHYWSPLVVGSFIYINGGSYGGIYGFDASNSGAQTFFNSTIGQYDSWSPTFSFGSVWSFVAGVLRKHDPASGAELGELDVGWTLNGHSMNTSAVGGSKYVYVVSPPNLIAVDPSTMKQAWAANASFSSYPATDGALVYAIAGGTLRVLDADTGALQWSFSSPTPLTYAPVVAAGRVYVSSAFDVYAVDLTSQKQVWTAPVGGALSVGEGMLLVSGGRAVTAFALSH
jgi:hypothetical protein